VNDRVLNVQETIPVKPGETTLLYKSDKSETAKVVILFCSDNAQCKNVYDHDVSRSAIVYIRPVPVGTRVSQTDAVDTNHYPTPARLKSPGIEVAYFGQAKVVLYWNAKAKSIEAIQTED